MLFNKLVTSTVAAYTFKTTAASSIYDIAKSSDDFSTLGAAIDASAVGPAGPNIVDALSGDGSFTVFAPTNSAFENLPPELVNKLLNSTWQPQLQDVLLYHALGSEVLSTSLSDGLSAETLNGEDITVNLDPPRINDNSNILIGDGLVDVEADNGIIHGIESVLTPTSVTSNIIDLGVADENFSTLVAAVTAAGLADALTGDGPLTLFAPTNDAFDALPEGTLGALLEPRNVDQLTDILLYHVVAANAHSAGLSSGLVETLNGASVDVNVSDSGVMVGDANVIIPNVIASNGIIHVIDAVILPTTEEEVSSEAEEETADSIIDIAKSSDNFSILVAAIEASTVGPAGPNLADALSGEGTFTVFAPTNDAFDKLPSELVTKLLNSTWQPQLQDVLLYHALGSEVLSTDLSEGLSAGTLNGEDITVNLDPTRINNSSNILIDEGLVDFEANNGVIHGVDRVLTPTSVKSSIVDIATGNDAFSTLVAAVTAAGLGDALSGQGPLTVFAPTNDAFDNLAEGTLDTLLEPGNVDQLTDILLYHVIAANAHSSGLSSGFVETLNGASVDLNVSDAGVMVDEANVIIPDIIASNGIIHVIDAVILPPVEEEVPVEPEEEVADSIIGIAKSSNDFSTLVAAIEASTVGPAGPNLDDALSREGTFTVFAPTNAAFDKLPSELLRKLLDSTWQPQLQDVLLYHALGSEVLSTDLSEGLSTETLNGEDITVNLDPPRINDNSSILIDDGLVDVEANNGVIHGVDSVLTPTSVTSNIVDLGAANDDFSILVAAVTAAGLVDALSGEGPLTLFAPTNDAFEALPEGTLDALLEPENVDQLSDILLYHVVAANAHSSGLPSGPVETINGASVVVNVTDAGIMVGDANVIIPDIIASNGIIHVIDDVILPPTEEGVPTEPVGETADSIIDIAKSSDDFSTLVAAIEASTVGPAGPNLLDALSEEGTFTIFAPSNAAFNKLPSELVSKILDSTWQPQLQDVLLYHVLGSEVLSTSLSEGLSAGTLNGEDITVNLDPPRINDYSNILIDDELVDVEANNGVIHGVDSVLTPTSVTSTIVDLAAANDAFSTLVAAVNAAGLGDALSGEGPLTVFAPTNDAFDALPEGTLDSLLEDENIGQLTDILLYHVVAANAHTSGLSGGPVETLNKAFVDVAVSGEGDIMVDTAVVVLPDIIASNGIIHVIDSVLLPPTDDDLVTNLPMGTATAAQTSMSSFKSSKSAKQFKFSKGSKLSKASKSESSKSKSSKSKSSKPYKTFKKAKRDTRVINDLFD